ncbi:hypothetical protein COCOBI_14-4630 [Coccomyxa sp. Obi]|nr:hypothetical protein COCOBI_14-4630 [Coccomyxa sp. Obi]
MVAHPAASAVTVVMRSTVGCKCWIAVLLTWVSIASLPQADARTLAHTASKCYSSSCSAYSLDDLRWAAEVVETVQPAPGQTFRGWRFERASLLEGVELDWRPLFVLGVGEILGHIVRGVTGFGSAIVLVSFWTICKSCGLDAGPFQSLIFADSICSLATAAPLVYITKPWKFASWRLVVTLLAFQALGAPVGAFLVLRLEPARLNFAIATALLVLFLLMVCPVAEGIRQLRARAGPRLKRTPDLRQPLLTTSPGAGADTPGKWWWPQWLQRKGRSQQAGYSALPVGIPAGDTSTPDTTSAKSSIPSKSPFSDASQQQRQFVFADLTDGHTVSKAEASAAHGATAGARFTGNPLVLSRKQSDSASSLRGPGGSSPTLPLKHISICEEPELAAACLRVGSAGGAIIEGNEGAVVGPGPGASFDARDAGLGGPDEGTAGRTVGRGEPVSSLGVRGQDLGEPSGTATGGPSDGGGEGGGSVSGDSDLAQTASTELGGIVIGVGPDPETLRAQSLATRTASQAAAEWTMDSRTLVPSAAAAATCAGMLSALSGIGGPPLILMFELLEVPKRVVRATMTTTSIVSVKFFTYLFMGSAQLSDVPLYCVAIISAYIGLNIGNAAAKRMNQQAFSKVLLAVMLLSTCLLYASSFGLTEH